MNISNATLKALSQGFQNVFLSEFGTITPTYPQVAMVVNSSAKIENYGWLKELPGMREWVGDRVINNLEATSAQLINKSWEHTFAVNRDDIEDDQLGIYNNLIGMQAETVARHPDELVWSLWDLGFTTNGFDGQYYFDTDHLSYDKNGNEVSWSNAGGGAGATWVLADLSRRSMKPLIFQNRRSAQFVAMTKLDDESVFMNKEYRFGADGRYVAGFGFHQLAFGAKDTLDATSFKEARLALTSQRRRDGTPLPVKPTHLIVGPSRLDEAEAIIKADFIGGTKNTLYNQVEIINSPYLG